MRIENYLKLSIFLAVLISTYPLSGQELVWDVDFNAVFANREGGDEMRPDQTFLFTRLAPEVGMQLVDERHNTHRLMGGVAWFQPLNDGQEGYKVRPLVYYRGYTSQGWQVTLGAFPRQLMQRELPKYLWSDSLNYCMPDVRGLMVEHHSSRGWMQAVVDWRQMQSPARREAFNAVFSGSLSLGHSPLYALGHIQYNHLAKRKDAPDDEGVNDDATINPMLGCRLNVGQVDANIEGGAIVQLQRNRAEDKWRTPTGFIGNLNARWHWLDVKQTVFAGKDLFPLYDRLGSELNLGDPYYRSSFYSRTDVRAHVFSNRSVDLSAMLTFHATDRITGLWQQVSCRFYISGTGKRTDKCPTPINPTF